MSPRPIINIYAPSRPALHTSPVMAGYRDRTSLRSSYKHLSVAEECSSTRALSPKNSRGHSRELWDYKKRTHNYPSSPRSSLTPLNGRSPMRTARILPQKILNPPRTEKDVESVWFKPTKGSSNYGVAMVDLVAEGGEASLRGSKDEMFKGIVIPNNRIQFSILWPGYGHVSWMASIPALADKKRGTHITRAKLASAVAQHFRAFMTFHSALRFAHPDPSWQISRDGSSGIRFEQLRLRRIFSCPSNNSDDSGCWQAEVFVTDY